MLPPPRSAANLNWVIMEHEDNLICDWCGDECDEVRRTVLRGTARWPVKALQPRGTAMRSQLLASAAFRRSRPQAPRAAFVTYDLVAPCTAGASGCARLRPSCMRQTHISSGARPAEAGLHWWVREWAGGWDLSWRPAVFPAARSTQLQHTLHARACWRRFAWCTQML